MAGKFPESFADPLYAQLDAANEQKLELPVGLLSSIRTAGERSNASATNKFGTYSPYQFIPATRKAILDKYGIDVLLSPENASEGAGLLLQESLKRSKGDVETAVREYHGGVNPENWGKVNDAYAKRVLASQRAAKLPALESGFAAFMAANPAVPPGDRTPGAAPAAPAASAAPADDPLADGFAKFMASKAPGVGAIPNFDGSTYIAPVIAPQADPSLVDRALGTGEAGLTALTGATTGTLGMIGGAVKGLAGSVMDGTFGTQEGVQQVDKAAGEGMAALTFQPRTASGQEQVGALGEVMQQVVPVMGLTAEMGALGKGMSATTRRAADVGAAGVQRVRAAAPAIVERVQRTLGRNPEPATPTPGTMASGGSAGTDMATIRTQNAESLPLPIKLTEGQATRNPDQLRFENETAKGQQGGSIRDRYSDQNELLQRNFDEWVDQTGKTTADVTETGKVVDRVLRKELDRDKAEVRVRYNKADKSEEALAPVDPGEVVSIGQGDTAIEHSFISYLNSKPSGLNTTALTDHAKQYAVKLGVAELAEDGSLIAKPTNVKTMEAVRKEISQATGYEPMAKRDSAILKGLIDAQTEPLAGPLYRDARRARENLAKKWENRSVVADLVNNKRGMDDRKVAIEDVFKHIVLDSDRSELGHMRRVLQTGGEQGQQAWRELQGQTVEWIKAESLKNVATDQRGNRIVSAAQLDKAIEKLDKKGKLEFIFGKQGAQQMRDINDLAKVVMTTPPGTVNTSNTASVLLAALTEAGVTGSMTGLPVPVLSALRLITLHAKNRRLQKRIEQALANRPANERLQPAPPPDRTLH